MNDILRVTSQHNRRAILSGAAAASVVAATGASAATMSAGTESELFTLLQNYCDAAHALNTYPGSEDEAGYKAAGDACSVGYDAVAEFWPTTLLGALVRLEFGEVDYMSELSRNAVRDLWRLAREQEPEAAARAYGLLSKLSLNLQSV